MSNKNFQFFLRNKLIVKHTYTHTHTHTLNYTLSPSSNKFCFEFKKITPKIYDFFCSLKFSNFYSFFIGIKVKQHKFKKYKIKN